MLDLNKLIVEYRNDKIKLIKLIKTDLKIGLKEAKDIVDRSFELKIKDSSFNANTLIESFYESRDCKLTNKNSNLKKEGMDDNKKLIRYGTIEEIWNANSTKILKFQQEIWHYGLNEYKVLTANDENILENKVKVQVDSWIRRWNDICEKKRNEEIKNRGINEANIRTKEAEEKLNEIENILINSIEHKSVINWDSLKRTEKFSISFPIKPLEPKYDSLPVMPNKDDIEFRPKFNFVTNLIKSKKNQAIEEAETKYQEAYKTYLKLHEDTINFNNQLKKEYDESIKEYNKKVDEWNSLKDDFIKSQKEYNEKIDSMKTRYFSYDVLAIIEYCKYVLNNLKFPDFIDKNFDLDYNYNNNILIIDFMLPNIDVFPKIKEVKYLTTKNEMKEIYYTDSFIERLYDLTIYRLILSIIREEFEADVINAIKAISFNGWINYINKATGIEEIACIASIQVRKEDFIVVDLKNVDPKACFKNFKGVASSKLAGITPIQPILTMNKNDKRFVESHNVTSDIDDSTNLATIPWEEFEHLIREIFEFEFSTNGGEVKVTQASRDGGVDAIAFDPDPIRGGKIVIQAKRYTNTVGVSAVRDLYGTVMNEGAIKGILVTTADYGPDAYEFAKNKPITLLNGSNLLYLLEKHGQKARIDLKEAKLINQGNY